jgi:acetyl CoA:N6-hydroxylysine acetyl transferase
MKGNATSSVFTFSMVDPGSGKTIAFRPVTVKEDLHRLHNWMNKSHVVPFWGLDDPLEQYRRHLLKALADTHQTLYIGLIDGEPMSYWESYWVKDDVIGKYYDYHPADQGVHLLIGPENYTGKGYALPLLRAMVTFQFQVQETDLVVAEPDIRNEKMIHIFKKCGFEAQKPVDLPDKTGLLMFCRRAVFERKWNDAKENR